MLFTQCMHNARCTPKGWHTSQISRTCTVPFFALDALPELYFLRLFDKSKQMCFFAIVLMFVL